MAGWFAGRLAGWLAGWLVGWPGWLGWLGWLGSLGGLAGWLSGTALIGFSENLWAAGLGVPRLKYPG